MVYEMLYIVPNQYSEDEAKEINKKVKNLAIKEGFEVVKEENLGKKKLAYPINQSFYGYYLLSYFKNPENKGDFINFNKKIKIMPEILRHQIIKYKTIPEKTKELTEKKPTEEQKPSIEKEISKITEDKPLEIQEKKKIEEKEPAIVEKKADETKKIDLTDLDKKIDELLENVDG